MSSTNAAAIAASVVEQLGGRYSTELGIDLDADDEEVERWFLAATLFGARISAQIAGRTFHELERAGIRRIADADKFSRDDLIAILDAGGYARYDLRTATRIEDLAKVVTERYDATVAEFGRRYTDPGELEGALGELPGWGAVTVGLFLRELRGVWPGAQPPLDARAADAARHLGLIAPGTKGELARITHLAELAGCDVRDLESALVRLAHAHRRMADCPGCRACLALESGEPGSDAPKSEQSAGRSATREDSASRKR
jgi:hypothetical protein